MKEQGFADSGSIRNLTHGAVFERGNVDMEQMEKDFSKLINFWKSIYLRKE